MMLDDSINDSAKLIWGDRNTIFIYKIYELRSPSSFLQAKCC